MNKLALCVSLEAKPGREEEAAEFLRSLFPLVGGGDWNDDLVCRPV
jgi:hypothetical protein